MNQILYTGGKNGKGKISDSKKIIIFFVVLIIIFGICLIGLGLNLFSKVKNKTPNENQANITNTTPNTPEEPESEIEIEFESQLGEINLKVTSKLSIANITYWWDEEEEVSIEPEDGETEYEVAIPSKQGTHTLYVEVTDENGNIETVTQVVIGDSEPELTINTDGISNYVIEAKDDEELDRMIIKINDEVVKEVEIKAKETRQEVAVPQGYSLIEVTVYNANGISITKKAQVTNFQG